MQKIKTTDEYVILKKGSGRYGVRRRDNRAWVRGEDKEKILSAEGLITKSTPKPKPAASEGEEASEGQ